MLDWRSLTRDPAHDKKVNTMVRDFLVARRQITHLELVDFFVDKSRGKRVLDIGVCEHDQGHMDAPEWKHGRIARAAKYCLGLDILADLVKVLANRGYNVRAGDATSKEDLGERFDVVIVGDVIEHVNDPVALLHFCQRHLSPGGRIYVSTPNPFFHAWQRKIWDDSTMIANLEHVCWVTPTNALEIAHRAGCELIHYHVPELGLPRRNLIRRYLTTRKPIELRAGYFIYEFGTHAG